MRTEDLREWKKASFTENRVDCGIEKTDGGFDGLDREGTQCRDDEECLECSEGTADEGMKSAGK